MRLIYLVFATSLPNILAYEPADNSLSPILEEVSASSNPFSSKAHVSDPNSPLTTVDRYALVPPYRAPITAPTSRSISISNSKAPHHVKIPPRDNGNGNYKHVASGASTSSSPASLDNSWKGSSDSKSPNHLVYPQQNNGRINGYVSSQSSTHQPPPSSPNSLSTIGEGFESSSDVPATPKTELDLDLTRNEQIRLLSAELRRYQAKQKADAFARRADPATRSMGPPIPRQHGSSQKLMFWKKEPRQNDDKQYHRSSRTMNLRTGLSIEADEGARLFTDGTHAGHLMEPYTGSSEITSAEHQRAVSALHKAQYNDHSAIQVNDQSGRYSGLAEHLYSTLKLMKSAIPVDEKVMDTADQGTIPVVRTQGSDPTGFQSTIDRYKFGRSSGTNSAMLRRTKSYPGSYRTIQEAKFPSDQTRKAVLSPSAPLTATKPQSVLSPHDKQKGVVSADDDSSRIDLTNGASSRSHPASFEGYDHTASERASISKAEGESPSGNLAQTEERQQSDGSISGSSDDDFKTPRTRMASSGSIRMESGHWSPPIHIAGNESPPSFRGDQQDASAESDDDGIAVANSGSSQRMPVTSIHSMPSAQRKLFKFGSSRSGLDDGLNSGSNRMTSSASKTESKSTSAGFFNKLKSCGFFACVGLPPPMTRSNYGSVRDSGPGGAPSSARSNPSYARKTASDHRSRLSSFFNRRRGSKSSTNGERSSAEIPQVLGTESNSAEFVNSPGAHPEVDQPQARQRNRWPSFPCGWNCRKNQKRRIPSGSDSRTTPSGRDSETSSNGETSPDGSPRLISLRSPEFGNPSRRKSGGSSKPSRSESASLGRMVDQQSEDFVPSQEAHNEANPSPLKQQRSLRSRFGSIWSKNQERPMPSDFDPDVKFYSQPRSFRSVKHVHWAPDEKLKHSIEELDRLDDRRHKCTMRNIREECPGEGNGLKEDESVLNWVAEFGSFHGLNLRKHLGLM